MFKQSNAFEQIISERRSVRRYLLRPVAQQTIRKLLQAACWAPSAHNRQPWRFAIVEKLEARKKLADAMAVRLRADLTRDGRPKAEIDADCGRSQERIISAPALILLCLTMTGMDRYPDEHRNQSEYLMAVQSVAMAGQNLMLSAAAAGLATCWLCAPLFCPEVVRKSLSLPDDWQAQGLISLGYPAEEREKARRPISECTLWF